jgi:hypothetical protein
MTCETKEWSTAQIAVARHAIGQHFFEIINCSTQKVLNQFFKQFLFSESRRMTAQITSAQVTTAQISTTQHERCT